MTMTMEDEVAVRTHGRKGITSFVIGIACITFIVIITVRDTIMTPNQAHGYEMIVGSGILLASFIGTIFGFFGARARRSKMLFSVLGLCLNIAVIVFFFVMAVIEGMLTG